MDIIAEIKNAWGWVGIDPVEIIGENDFGNLIIRDAAGRYWRLCPEDSYCKIVADDFDAWETLSHNEEFIVDWHMMRLVELAKVEHGPLEDGRKYCLAIPGVVGGSYDVSNIKTVSFLELIRFSGDFAEQIHDAPDGQAIEIKVIDSST